MFGHITSTAIIREIQAPEYAFIHKHIQDYWGGEPLVIRGKQYYSKDLPGIVSIGNNKILGFLLYEIRGTTLEIIVFEVFEKYQGTGTALLNKLKEIAKKNNCTRIYLMTTNDNIDALRFYQKRGFYITGIHVDSVKISRAIKPTIGEIGDYGIPVRDEIDLELVI